VKKAQEPDGNWSEAIEAILGASSDGLKALQCWIAPECETLASAGHAAKAFGAFCALVDMATRKKKPSLGEVWEKIGDLISEGSELLPQIGAYLEEHGTLGELAALVKQGKVVFDVVAAIHRYQAGEAGAPSQLDDLFIQLGTDVGPEVIGALFTAEFGEGVGRVAKLLAQGGTQKLAAFMGEIRKGYQIAADEEGTAARNDVEYQRQTESNAEQNGLSEDQAKQLNVLLNAVAGPQSSAYLRDLEQQDPTSLAHVVDEMTALRQGDLAMLSGVRFMYDQLSYQNIDRATKLSWLDSAGHAANACAQLLPSYQGSDEPMFSFLDALRIDLTTFCSGLQAGGR
jgi:hypothetical protein